MVDIQTPYRATVRANATRNKRVTKNISREVEQKFVETIFHLSSNEKIGRKVRLIDSSYGGVNISFQDN